MLYGESGAGKSSLVNAGLLPEATRLGFTPGRARVQPRTGEELVIGRIATADDDAGSQPLLFAPDDEGSSRIVLSTQAFEERLRAACSSHRPLIVFDQFEEIVTLFDEPGAREARQRLVELIVELLRGPLPVKLLFAFREDYLGKVKQLLTACPELVDQALLLTPPAADALPTIIRGPFERYPGHFAREFSPGLAERLRAALAERFSAGDLSLSEVQTVCLRLWQVDEPEALLAAKGVQGLLEDYVGEALEAFPPELRGAAIAVLGQMLTSAGTRNVMSAEDLIQRVREDEDIPPPVLQEALERLESESRLVRRERRRDLYLYEITSEFLLPWISRRRDEFRRAQDRRRYRRRLRVLGSIAGVLVLLGAAVALWALEQRDDAERRANAAASALARNVKVIPASVRKAGCEQAQGEDFWMDAHGAEEQLNCRLPSSALSKAVRGGGLTYGLFPSARKARDFVRNDFEYEVKENESMKARPCGEAAERQLKDDYPGGNAVCYTNKDGVFINWSYRESAVAVQLYFDPGTSPDAAVNARTTLLPEARLLEVIRASVRKPRCEQAQGEDFWMDAHAAEAQLNCRLPSSALSKAVRGGGLTYGLFPSARKARDFVRNDFEYEVKENESMKARPCGEATERQMKDDYPGSDAVCYTNKDGVFINWSDRESAVAVQLYFDPGTSPDAAVNAGAELL
jgi:hypothetical protein